MQAESEFRRVDVEAARAADDRPISVLVVLRLRSVIQVRAAVFADDAEGPTRGDSAIDEAGS